MGESGLQIEKYWSGLPLPSPGDLHNPGVEPVSLMSPALAGGFFTAGATWEAPGGDGARARQVVRPSWLLTEGEIPLP